MGTIRRKLAGTLFSAFLPIWFGTFLFPTAVPARAAGVTTDAWWNVLSAGTPIAPPSTVPDDSIAVGHNGLAADKIAAIAIDLNVPKGATLDTLKLTLKESAASAATLSMGGATVVACPITGPWEAVHNGAWSAVPTYDCALAKSEGKTSPDGTWTFDLLEVGKQWLDEEFPLEQAGVIFFVEQTTLPVQISFLGIKTGEFRLEVAVTKPEQHAPAKPVVVGGLPPTAPVTPISAPAPSDTIAPAPAEPAVLVTQPAQNHTEAIARPNLTGNLPWATWLLVPIAIAVAAAVSYALAPGRDGNKGSRRLGAVSRALSRSTRER